MRFCLAVFRSRNETLYLANMLSMAGYRVSVINTPKDAGLTCGISVRFDESLSGLLADFTELLVTENIILMKNLVEC